MVSHGVKRTKISKRSGEEKKKEQLKIKSYRLLTKDVLDMRDKEVYDVVAFDLTTKLLDWNPEFYTVWNYRRDILTNGLFKEGDIASRLDNELYFIKKQLQKFPKVYWIWTHRMWSLENHPTPNWQAELGLVDMLLSIDARNFHGWHYRRYIVSHIEGVTNKSMSESELEFTKKNIFKNSSNFSAWHNRTKLIPILLKEAKKLDLKQFMDPVEVFKGELAFADQAVFFDPDDQSGWIYHSWVLLSNEFGVDNSVLIESIEKEIKAITELNEEEENNKWCLNSILVYTIHLAKLRKSSLTSTEKEDLIAKVRILEKIDPARRNRYLHLEKKIAI